MRTPCARRWTARIASIESWSPLALVLLVAALAAACGGDGEESVTVYSGRSRDLIGPILERFSEQSGIEVRVRYASTAELAATLLEEGGRSPADLYIAQDAGALGAVEAAGLFAELDRDLLERVPAAFRSSAGRWVGLSGRARTIIYNTEQVESGGAAAVAPRLHRSEMEGKDRLGAHQRLVPGVRHRAAAGPRRRRRARVAGGHPGQRPGRVPEEHADRGGGRKRRDRGGLRQPLLPVPLPGRGGRGLQGAQLLHWPGRRRHAYQRRRRGDSGVLRLEGHRPRAAAVPAERGGAALLHGGNLRVPRWSRAWRRTRTSARSPSSSRCRSTSGGSKTSRGR